MCLVAVGDSVVSETIQSGLVYHISFRFDSIHALSTLKAIQTNDRILHIDDEDVDHFGINNFGIS
jgi:hypothetical protein